MRSDHHRFHVNLARVLSVARVLSDWLPMDAWQCEVTTIVSSDVGGFVFQSASAGEVKRDLLSEPNHRETFASPRLHQSRHTGMALPLVMLVPFLER